MGLRLPGRPREGLRCPKLLPFFLNKHDVLCPHIFCPEPSYRYFPLITLRVVALVLNCCLKGDGNFPFSPPGWILALIVKVGADRQIGSMSLLPKGVLTKSKQPSLIPPPWTWLAATSPVSPHHQTWSGGPFTPATLAHQNTLKAWNIIELLQLHDIGPVTCWAWVMVTSALPQCELHDLKKKIVKIEWTKILSHTLL